MRYSILSVLLPALVQGAVVSFDRRQDGEVNSIKDGVATRKINKMEDIPPVSGIPGTKRMRVTYGPFTIRGTSDKSVPKGSTPSMDTGGTAYNFRLGDDFPRDITTLLSQSYLLNSKGNKVTMDDKIYNHHNVFLEVEENVEHMYACEDGVKAKDPPPVRIFAGTSTEKIEQNFTSDSTTLHTGFYISKTAKLQNMVDLVNLGPDTQEVLSIHEVEYIPGKPAGYLNSIHTMINPDTCGGSDGYALHPPAGQKVFTVASKTIVMNQSGWVSRARGHLHDGGNNVKLEVNGKLVCTSTALYGGPGFEYKANGKSFQTINKSTECTDPIMLKKGDKLVLSANFDLDKHPSRPMGGTHEGMKTVLDGDAEQMAIMFINFAKVD